jgi:hypothetical protein
MPRRTFRPQRKGITKVCRTQHNEELQTLYSLPGIITSVKLRLLRGVGHLACMGEKRFEYKAPTGKSEGEIPLATPRHRWEDTITLDLLKIRLGRNRLD